MRLGGTLPAALAGLLCCCCATRVPAYVVAWNPRQSIVAPPGPSTLSGVGYLRVETDSDLRLIGRETYYNVLRPYDVYSAEGTLLSADVDNDGGRNGEVPRTIELAPGRYVVASVYGATYRKVQVVVHPGQRTDVASAVLRDAPAVFVR